MMHRLTSHGLTSALSSTLLIAAAPRSEEEREDKDLLKSPIGVRDPATIAISAIARRFVRVSNTQDKFI